MQNGFRLVICMVSKNDSIQIVLSGRLLEKLEAQGAIECRTIFGALHNQRLDLLARGDGVGKFVAQRQVLDKSRISGRCARAGLVIKMNDMQNQVAAEIEQETKQRDRIRTAGNGDPQVCVGQQNGQIRRQHWGMIVASGERNELWHVGCKHLHG